LRERMSGDVRAGVALAQHTTLRVGGTAAAFVRAESEADLVAVAAVCEAQGRPWLVLGRGSNLLVADRGWPGVVVTLGRGFRGVEVDPSGPAAPGTPADVLAGAAEPMPVLARTVAARGLGGLAFGVAIPGTLGGAVRMNAGAHGRDMAQVLQWAEVVRLGRRGEKQRLTLEDLRPAYRHTELPADAVVVRACLRLHHAEAESVAEDMREMRAWRRRHQPVNEPSCGSVFRNPPGDSAGRLIEISGLKGYTVGAAHVSRVHANFIIADPKATAADVHAVIRHVQHVVARRHGVHLQTEVVLAGFADQAPAARAAGGHP
jgi:UDP-N-acetylmuramate dehydrogenase